MKKIISGRHTGKTEKLIRLSAESNTPIVTKDIDTTVRIMKKAEQLGLNIPHPVSIGTIMDERVKGHQISSVIIDDAEYVLAAMLREYNVGPIAAISICNDDIEDGLL